MNTFANLSWLTNIRRLFSLHPDHIIEQFLSPLSHSPMFDDFATSNVLFLFIETRSLNHFSEDDETRPCLMISQHPMSIFSSSRWDHWKTSLSIIRFANVWWLTNIRCAIIVHQDNIIEQFHWRWTHSPIFDNWLTSDVLFRLIEIRLFNNFPQHHHIRQCLINHQHPMYFFYSSRSDHWTIYLSIITFANVWWFTNIQCPPPHHRDQINEQFLLLS